MRGAVIQERRGVSQVDSAADLQAAGKGLQRRPRGGLIPRTEHDHMAAGEAVTPVELGEPGARPFRDKIRANLRGIVTQRAADDLLDLAFVQVDARTKHGFRRLLRGYRQALFILLVAHEHTLLFVGLEHKVGRGGDDALDSREFFRNKGRDLAQVFALDHDE
jgi:hypothetical protein